LAERDELTYEALPTSYGIRRTLEERPPTAPAGVSIVPGRGEKGAAGQARILIDGQNLYDSNRTWQDYERLITTKAYQANNANPAKTAQALDLSVATLYKRLKEYNLTNPNNPLYQDPFIYDPKLTLHDYVKKIFHAAHEYSGSHPYTAIKWLGVSQGYFYKILKELKQSA
jgi:hypothetical protein